MLGALAAMVVLSYSTAGATDPDLPAPEWWPAYVFFGTMFVLEATALLFLPALVAIVVSEFFRLQSPIYWLGVGGFIGLLPNVMANAIAPPDAPDEFSFLVVPAGLAWGLVYWLAAGRLAGNGFRSAPPPGPA